MVSGVSKFRSKIRSSRQKDDKDDRRKEKQGSAVKARPVPYAPSQSRYFRRDSDVRTESSGPSPRHKLFATRCVLPLEWSHTDTTTETDSVGTPASPLGDDAAPLEPELTQKETGAGDRGDEWFFDS
eukprot:TRINITY_DN4643_c0_g2_i1.p4 TRINITY_DN4643_c0_g2~~TRINITY_DN4643_c0_g2_i1.p4  ORF type:complete len:127 (+),score=13.15 TRINITY_DN4643_c0_g2_i1:46-426(+)